MAYLLFWNYHNESNFAKYLVNYQQNPSLTVRRGSKGNAVYFLYCSFDHHVMFPTAPVISRSILIQTVNEGYSNGLSFIT